MKKARIIGLAICLMLGANLVFAGETFMCEGEKHEKPCCKMMYHSMKDGMHHNQGKCNMLKKYLILKDELKLTDEQIDKIKEIENEYMKEEIKMEADIKIERINLRETFYSKKPDFQKARSIAEKISGLELKRKLSKIDSAEKGYNVLTEEQKSKLPALRKKTVKKNMGKMKK